MKTTAELVKEAYSQQNQEIKTPDIELDDPLKTAEAIAGDLECAVKKEEVKAINNKQEQAKKQIIAEAEKERGLIDKITKHQPQEKGKNHFLKTASKNGYTPKQIAQFLLDV